MVHTTPLTWEHIGFSGDFLWERAAAAASKRRPLNLWPRARGGLIWQFAESSTLALFI
jgi:hypothetical protein